MFQQMRGFFSRNKDGKPGSATSSMPSTPSKTIISSSSGGVVSSASSPDTTQSTSSSSSPAAARGRSSSVSSQVGSRPSTSSSVVVPSIALGERAEKEMFVQAWKTLEDQEELTLEVSEDNWQKAVQQVPQVGILTPHRLQMMDSGPTPSTATGAPTTTMTNLSLNSLAEAANAAPEEEWLVKDPNYKGPHISVKPTMVDVMKLIEAAKGGVKLHKSYVTLILRRTIDHLKCHCGTVNRVSFPADAEGAKVVVVGDIHGQLTDLLTIFDSHGMPSPKNLYIFNGDFVDRGPQGIAVVLILYALRLADPKTIFFNRGNHEQAHLNAKYTFEREVMDQYSLAEYEMFELSFRWLPMATVLNNAVAIIHGGLPPDPEFTIEELAMLKRIDIYNSCEDHVDLFKCLLWSDPKTTPGWCPSRRGSGIEWGPDLTEAFLEANHLSLLIRSHEQKDEGFEVTHNGLVITIFSASSYCGVSDNKGAVAIFDKPPTFQPDGKPIAPRIESFRAMVFQDASESCKAQTLDMIKKQFYQLRHKLIEGFSAVPNNRDGMVSVEDFCKVLGQVIPAQLNWQVLYPYFVTLTGKNRISFTEFLARYRVDGGREGATFWRRWSEEIVTTICEKIIALGLNLKRAFAEMDTDGNHQLSYREFTAALTRFSLGLSGENIFDLFQSIDTNKNGQIESREFFSQFEATFNRLARGAKAAQLEEMQGKVKLVVKTLSAVGGGSLAKAMEKMGANQIGYLSPEEFCSGLEVVGIKWTVEEVVAFITFVNEIAAVLRSKHISTEVLNKAHNTITTANTAAATDALCSSIIGPVVRTLQAHSLQLHRLFTDLDTDNTGTLSYDEFFVGMSVINQLLAKQLSDHEIRKLFEAIDIDHSGTLSYEEFFNSFSAPF